MHSDLGLCGGQMMWQCTLMYERDAETLQEMTEKLIGRGPGVLSFNVNSEIPSDIGAN
jgi:hypothetical protein